MKRIFRVSLGLSILATLLTPISAQGVSSTPAAVCSGANCTVTFPYTGEYYLWVAPATGTYTFEVWGAQGGNAAYGASVTTYGGKGGYATGSISLTAGQNVYVYVGGQGEGGGTATQNKLNGGFNGGGFGYNGSDSINRGGGGGGATDIRTTSNALSNRVIVGGGGAGGAYYPTYGTNYPGVGGGAAGGDGAVTNYNSPQYQGKGGTQSAGGAGGNNGSVGTAGQLGLGGDAGHAYGFSEAGGGGGYWGGGASGTGMAGGGGSGYVGGVTATQNIAGNGTMPDPAGGNVTGRSGNGVARITYANATNPTAFSTSQTTPTNTSSPISYSLTFSQIVNTVDNGDFANSGTATGCAFSISAASGSSFTLTVSSCGAGTLVPKLLAGSVYGTVSGTSGPVSDALTSSPITIDRTAPTISSVSAPGNSTYSNNQTPTFTVVFSESVTVTGTPRLTLTVGSSTKYANFLALTDSRTATFRYTVTTDPIEFDTDGISVSTTVDLNNGSISDLATNAISNLTFTAPTLTSVFVAQLPVAPTIDSVVATSGTLTIYFTPGAARGSTTSGYQYTTDNNTFKNRESGTLASPLVITTVSTGAPALANGTGYLIRIRAVTNAGNSSISNLVNETPTAISVSGDSTLTLTYGSSASTSSYSATGGTSSYTWSLGSVISGITLSGTVVTASNTLAAGTYSQTVRATDTNSQVGSRSLTITVNKASTSISIALPNSSTSAALGGAVTITATVPRAGSVNFMLGGSTISGCGSASAASTSATCSWTPGALGSVSLTATFTPTDSSNFETSTTTTLSITVVNGVSTVTLSLTGGTTTPPKGQSINIIAAVDQAGRITFLIDGKRIPGCFNKSASIGNVTCSWKPVVQKVSTITARLVPTNNVYNPSTSSLKVQVMRRTGLR
jgi:hypothetical protein